MGPSDTGTIPHPVTEELRATIAAAGITESTDLVARILATGRMCNDKRKANP